MAGGAPIHTASASAREPASERLFMTKEKLVAQMFPVKLKVSLALGVGMPLGWGCCRGSEAWVGSSALHSRTELAASSSERAPVAAWLNG